MDSSRQVSWRIAVVLLWVLVNLCCCWNCCQGRCLHQERTALLNIKHSINRTNSYALSDWKGQGCCQWSRVSCDSSTSRVTGVDLSYTRDTSLDESWYPNASLFTEFKDLEYLDLSGNNISGLIMPQALCKLRNLHELHIHYNGLVDTSIPECLANLSSLEVLGLSNNRLIGSFDLCGMKSLTNLDLTWNQLIRLPLCLENFPFLTTLDMTYNNLSTTTSLEGLCKLKNLETLFIDYNKLVDTSIPPCLANLSSLEALHLSNNHLMGAFDLCGLKSLTNLDLNDNQLTWLPRCLENSSSLTTLTMGQNNLSTTTSFEGLCRLRNLTSLDISGNKLMDTSIPLCMANLSSLAWLYLSNNQLFGAFEFYGLKNLTNIDLSHNQLIQSPRFLENLPSLTTLNMGGNNLSTTTALEGLCRLRNLTSLDISGNKLVDTSIPLCMANLSSLEELDLSHNQLIGAFDLCGLKSLTNMNLRNNQLIQSHFLENLPSLIDLYMDSNNLSSTTSLEGLCRLRNLQTLSINDNKLVDTSIPPCLANISSLGSLYLIGNQLMGSFDLCGFTSLTILYLNENQCIQLPRCLGNLTALTNLYMRSNNLGTFSLEGLCRLMNLTSLDISDNKLVDTSIPLCIANLSSLEYLYLSNNQLIGAFDLRGLKSLTGMDLSNNQLVQSPHLLENLTSLTTLDMAYNNLSTTTSLEGLCRLRNLQKLSINNNKLVDSSIPPCLANISSLEYLELSGNQLMGSFDLCGFTNLANLYLNENQCIQLPRCLGNLTALKYLYMGSNNLSTFSLEGLCMLWNLEGLDLSSNRLGESIPLCLSNLQSLRYLLLSSNQLKGNPPFSLFNNLTSLISIDLSHNQFDNVSFSISSSSLVFLDISSNNIHGMLPDDINLLFPKLAYFNMSHNFLQGAIPLTLGDIKGLQIIDLSKNSFSGEIPNQLLTMATSLEYLDLSGNRLDGKMLPRQSNVPSLKFLNVGNNSLTGAIPTWISSLQQLNVLIMKGNHFKGQIPIQLCQMENLFILDISHNHLTGKIPTCFNNITSWMKESQIKANSVHGTERVEFMTKGNSYSYEGIVLSMMTGIDLSSNKLTGCIPSQLGYLVEVHSLNLSHNNLGGPIPESFENMKQIESLDFSFNQLNGTIPPTLIQLYRLSTFRVAHNNLTGRIPDDKYQFATFDASSYIGNVGLCGKALNKSCSTISGATDKKENGKSFSIITNDYFPYYLTAAISYILGFWGIILLLYFNKDLGRKYFEAVDICIDYCVLQFQLILLRTCNFQFK